MPPFRQRAYTSILSITLRAITSFAYSPFNRSVSSIQLLAKHPGRSDASDLVTREQTKETIGLNNLLHNVSGVGRLQSFSELFKEEMTH